ncbi:hypothetical protein HPB51_003223 [Rhipicephalus microplus]|uniref:Uncharacterized protein n=1 Tax=Rhipicephalus microplus TaxID=6941 RepID=A0A9J6DF36_RHIMP|nr:hypothetical protein HPB51_003223 [Rhipicephalus microplus]
MPFSSPAPGACLWSASLPPQEIPVDQFLRNGVPAVPVALVPSNDGFIPMKKPKVVQAELRAATSHFHSITEVRQFGRGGILCFSSDQLYVQDILKCSSFTTNPANDFIPPHLACVKGIVRGVDVNLTPSEVLEMLAVTGAISVYRCARLVEKQKMPTESAIVTFAEANLPSKIKAWPLIYRVEPLSLRSFQFTKCWRYGHTIKGCRWISVAWWKPRSRSCRSDKWSRVVVSVVDGGAHGLRHKSGGLGNLDAQRGRPMAWHLHRRRSSACPRGSRLQVKTVIFNQPRRWGRASRQRQHALRFITDQPRRALAAAAKKPVLVHLDIDSIDGGTSPWFRGMGRMFVAMVTTDPENTDLFGQLAIDGTMGTLVSYLDTEQAMVGFIALLCYIVLGLTLISLFVVLPVAALALRRHTVSVGLVKCLMCGLVVVGSCLVLLICLMSMISTWYAMKDALGEKAPEAYEWTFEPVHNYTQLTVTMLKVAKDPDFNLDKSLTATTNSIKWLKGNITAWESSFSAFESLQGMTTGLLYFLQMGVLGLGMATAVSSALLGCVAWNRRKRNLEQGKKSPIFVSTIIVASVVLLLVHLIIALPMIARWLPLCVKTNTYLCASYRDSSYVVLDDAITRLWPPSSRPEPFCWLVPSNLAVNCSTKGKAPIKSLPACPNNAAKKKTFEVPGEDAVMEVQVMRPPQPKAAAAPAAKVKVNGDCFYPYKIIDTDMTAACPLYSDNLVAHWMAMVVSVIFGVLAAMAAGALAVVYFAVGEMKPKKKKIKKNRRERCVRKV